MVVRLTAKANEKLMKLLAANGQQVASFFVKGGGCNGLQYVLEPGPMELTKFDEVVDLGGGKELHVCGKSLLHLMGTEIDWKDDFMGQSFHFANPNVGSTCGCGATFTPKSDSTE